MLRRRERSAEAVPGVAPRRSLVGTTAPAVEGTDPSGAPASWPGDDRGVGLLAFMTGGCVSCQPFWEALAHPQAAPAATLGDRPVTVVTPGPGTESRLGMAERAAGGLRVIMSTDAWLHYEVRGTPWFAVVDGGIIRAEGTATTWGQLDALTRA